MYILHTVQHLKPIFKSFKFEYYLSKLLTTYISQAMQYLRDFQWRIIINLFYQIKRYSTEIDGLIG